MLKLGVHLSTSGCPNFEVSKKRCTVSLRRLWQSVSYWSIHHFPTHSSSGSATEKRATPLPGEEARDRGAVMAANMYRVGGKRTRVRLFGTPPSSLFYGGLAIIHRARSFISQKAKELCASTDEDGVKRRMVMKSSRSFFFLITKCC